MTSQFGRLLERDYLPPFVRDRAINVQLVKEVDLLIERVVKRMRIATVEEKIVSVSNHGTGAFWGRICST